MFDFANPNLVTGNRITSTLPTQALFLMNNPLVIEQSGKAAERLLRTDLQKEEQIRIVYRQVLGRAPLESEFNETREYLESFSDEQEAWSSIYHALFASLDFRYVE